MVAFLLQVAIARLLGAEQFGIYSVTLAMVALIEVPLVVRGSELAMRSLGEALRRNALYEMKVLARSMFFYDLRLFISTSILLSVFAWALYPKLKIDPWLFMILTLMIPAQTGLGVFKSYFTIFDKVADMIRYELIYVVALAGLNLIGLVIWGLYGLGISMVLAMVVKTYLAYYFTQKYLPNIEGTNSSNVHCPSLTKEGMFSIIRNLFSNGFNQIDIILLGLFQKPEATALYKIGKSLASLPIKIAFPVWRYLQPKLMKAIQSGDKHEERRVILAGSLVLLFVMLCLIPPVLYFGEEAIVFLYGEEYLGAFNYFLILVIGVWAFHGITGWFKLWVVVTNSRLFGIGVYAVAFLTTIALGVSFGALSSDTMSYVVTFVLLVMSVVAYVKVFRA